VPPAEVWTSAAAHAAGAWGIEPSSVEVISHTENVVCRIDQPNVGPLVLRLHRPGYNSLSELESEVTWVESLRAAGLPVPQQLPTLAGDHFVEVVVAGERRHVGVIGWIDGQPVEDLRSGDGSDVVGHYRRAGELAALIRTHNESWVAPAGFIRRRWDAAGLVGEAPVWGRFWDRDALSGEQRRLFSAARTSLVELLTSVPTGPERFGMIHADLHLRNVMADGERLTMIDFDDAGWGYYVHELAVALHPAVGEPWFAAARDALLDGYASVWPLAADEVELLDAFLTIRALMVVSWLDDRPELDIHAFLPHVIDEAVVAAEQHLGRAV